MATIIFNGSKIATLSEGQTARLECSGKVMTDNVVISTLSLITFKVENTTYLAEEGMTWGEWIDSVYNTENYTIATANAVKNYISIGGQVFIYERVKTGDGLWDYENIYLLLSREIIDGKEYNTKLILYSE